MIPQYGAGAAVADVAAAGTAPAATMKAAATMMPVLRNIFSNSLENPKPRISRSH
ncbi:MAG TPA: hypothetical protein VGP26_12995 [Actinophytocola sp.]|nr:hypothetical protein [Actinophytocola sp.]